MWIALIYTIHYNIVYKQYRDFRKDAFAIMKATIFDIQRNSYVDGPGIRTTVFFKGCNLRCAWCHNPESQRGEKEFLLYPDKCTGCGRCQSITTDDAYFFCYNDAKEICGKDYSVDEVFNEVIKDKTFYDNSDGGVTFSGGECMLQIDFLLEILKKCKENHIHTAVDTAGCVPWEYFERVMPHTDLFLYDVKIYDSETHKKYIGVDNKLILSNLEKLLKSGCNLWIRVPVISGINDTEKEIKSIRDFVYSKGSSLKTELLPYHAMGEHKYTALGMECQKFASPDEEKMKELKKIVM